MKKKSSYVVSTAVIFLITAALLGSCADDNLNDLTKQEINDQTTEIFGKRIAIEDKTLSFENENDLQEVINQIEDQQLSSTRMAMDGVYLSSNYSLNIVGFQSLHDVFEEAMRVATSYYEREGGYEEFKERFSTLYFPEHGDDYSAYLPVSDIDLAKLLNRDGEIIIGGERKKMNDISSYDKLIELGLTLPENENTISTRSTNDVPSNVKLGFPGEMFYNKTKRRRFEFHTSVTIQKLGDDTKYDTPVKVSFRSKNFLGVWYNHSSYACAQLGWIPSETPIPAHNGSRFYTSIGYSPLTLNLFRVVPFYAPSQVFYNSVCFEHVEYWVSYVAYERK